MSSDMYGNEPNAANTGGYTGGAINVPVPAGLESATRAIAALTTQMQSLQQTMLQFGQQQYQMGQGVANTFSNVQTSATSATDSIKTFFQSLSGNRPSGSTWGAAFNYGMETGIIEDVAMFPLRYMQSTIGQNRQFALNVGGALAGQQYATGVRTTPLGTPGRTGYQGGLFGTLAQTFGSGNPGLPTGTGEEIAQFLNIARQAGAMEDLTQWTGGGRIAGGNPRTPGFLTSAYQMQQMNPAMPLGQIGATIGGFAASTRAQQQGAYLTGGAFSMVKRGGQLKSISEWSESILRWLEGQRPGPKRGQGFTYGELITQQYPGSNIDAWFDAQGVPPDMQEQFWNYALAKARTSSSQTTTGAEMQIEAGLPGGQVQNPALQRLRSTQPLTRTSFGLASRMAGAYNRREDVNKEFNQMLGGALQKIVPATLAGPLGAIQSLPDTVEELLMTILERTPGMGAAIGGAIGWGALGTAGIGALIENLFQPDGILFQGILGSLPSGIDPDLIRDALTSALDQLVPGDYGDSDVGDWTSQGSTTASSLHPSMNRKVSAMMKANPRLKMNSGRRDEVTQRRLRAKGYNRVSGKSSAHTRGLAADLGPRSEYGWIAQNAHKFGLKSGAGVGEPWHVGMPGVGDLPSTIGSLLTGGADAVTTGGLSMGGLLNLLFGQFASEDVAGKSDADIDAALAYDPTYASKLFAASTYTTGGKFKASTIFADIAKAFRERIARQGGGATTTATGPSATGSESLSGALTALGLDPGGSAGAQVAKLAHHAGFTGEDLIAAVAISGRESSFEPTAHRSDVDKALMRGDRGLWQINAGAWNKLLLAEGFIKSETDRAIFDPWVNAQIARMIFLRSNNFSAWTMGPNGWDPNGDPFYGTDKNAAAGYVKEAGLGDTDGGYQMSAMRRASGGTGPIQFNNNFIIQGTGGGGGIDTRRIVVMLADQLEGEMRRRMARAN